MAEREIHVLFKSKKCDQDWGSQTRQRERVHRLSDSDVKNHVLNGFYMTNHVFYGWIVSGQSEQIVGYLMFAKAAMDHLQYITSAPCSINSITVFIEFTCMSFCLWLVPSICPGVNLSVYSGSALLSVVSAELCINNRSVKYLWRFAFVLYSYVPRWPLM